MGARKDKTASLSTPAQTPSSDAGGEPPALKEGDAAPDFDLPVAGGGRARLRDVRGRLVVLYFYPKDDTPGCTQQAISFSEHADDFTAADAVVIGISRDSVKKHEAFTAKHGLTVTLAADEDGAVCAAYGVWKEKTLYGRAFMGIERSTFLIGRDGRVLKAWRKVKVPGHCAIALDAARAAPDR